MTKPTDAGVETPAAEATTTHKVIKLGLTHNRRECQIGEVVELTEQQRLALIDRKFIDGPKKPDPADKK